MPVITWLLLITTTAIIEVVWFFRLAHSTGVLKAFGRSALSWNSLIYLGLMGALPSVTTLLLVTGPFEFSGAHALGFNGASLLISCIATCELMQWLSRGIYRT